MQIKTSVIFGRVKSKSKNTRRSGQGNWEYTLSNGHCVVLKSDDLLLGKWYFFEVSKDTQQYVSHSLLATKVGENIASEIASMKLLTFEVTNMWRNLEKADRHVLMRELGILFSTGTCLAALYAAPATGGWSIPVALGAGAMAYLQYEDRKDALVNQRKCMASFLAKRDMLSTLFSSYTPDEYSHLPIADPVIEGIATKLRIMIENFNVYQFFNSEATEWQYAGV